MLKIISQKLQFKLMNPFWHYIQQIQYCILLSPRRKCLHFTRRITFISLNKIDIQACFVKNNVTQVYIQQP